HPDAEPALYRAEVMGGDVLAAINGAGEMEVVVDPETIREISTLELDRAVDRWRSWERAVCARCGDPVIPSSDDTFREQEFDQPAGPGEPPIYEWVPPQQPRFLCHTCGVAKGLS